MQTHVSQQWLNWLKENLERGCVVDSLVKIMRDNHFEAAAVMRAVALVQQSIDANQPNTIITSDTQIIADTYTTDEYVYEKPRVPMDVNHINTCDKRVYISFKVEKPVILVFDNLLSHLECDELIELSRSKLQRSTVVDDTTGAQVLHNERTSLGTFFNRDENQLIKTIERRIADIICMPVKNGEGLQILNYHPGGEYTAHFDYFPYETNGSHKHLAQAGQRVATLIMYLNDVEQGGATHFPKIGVHVVPKKGAAVYFEYCNSKHQVDPLTLHAGLPVIKGEKWIATKWVRERRYP